MIETEKKQIEQIEKILTAKQNTIFLSINNKDANDEDFKTLIFNLLTKKDFLKSFRIVAKELLIKTF